MHAVRVFELQVRYISEATKLSFFWQAGTDCHQHDPHCLPAVWYVCLYQVWICGLVSEMAAISYSMTSVLKCNVKSFVVVRNGFLS